MQAIRAAYLLQTRGEFSHEKDLSCLTIRLFNSAPTTTKSHMSARLSYLDNYDGLNEGFIGLYNTPTKTDNDGYNHGICPKYSKTYTSQPQIFKNFGRGSICFQKVIQYIAYQRHMPKT